MNINDIYKFALGINAVVFCKKSNMVVDIVALQWTRFTTLIAAGVTCPGIREMHGKWLLYAAPNSQHRTESGHGAHCNAMDSGYKTGNLKFPGDVSWLSTNRKIRR